MTVGAAVANTDSNAGSTALTPLMGLRLRRAVPWLLATVTSSCGERRGLGTFHVTVNGDTVQVVAKDHHTGPTTVVRVDQLFEAVKRAEDYHADSVKVICNWPLWYPESINVDDSTTGIDDEECYTVRQFTTEP
jgi:hypothetical protein